MKLKANEYTYCIKNLTYDEIRRIEYAYGQHIHNAVSGDFVCTNDILAQLKARIEKKPIKATTSEEDFITIPKPKFKVGDKVSDKDFYPYWINECFYDLLKNEWWYVSRHGERVYESELELVGEGE